MDSVLRRIGNISPITAAQQKRDPADVYLNKRDQADIYLQIGGDRDSDSPLKLDEGEIRVPKIIFEMLYEEIRVDRLQKA